MQNNSFRVMQIISNLDIGGAQEVVHTLVKYLAQEGHCPVVCTLKDGPLRHNIEQLGIPVVVVPGRRHSIVAFPFFIADIWRLRKALAALVEKHEIDIVQTHLLRSLDFLVLSLRWGTRLRLIFWTIHNFNFTLREDQLPGYKWLLGPKRFVHRLLYLFTTRWVDGFIGVSDEVRTAILEKIGNVDDKVTIICNGVDVERYKRQVNRSAIRQKLGFSEDVPLVAMVGTFKKQKGHACLIEAVALIVSQFPDIQLILIGDGGLRQELQNQVRRLNLEDNIHFLGSRGDIPDLLAVSDYFVLPSLWEGLPMALLEAMASALPIVATDVSGSKQVMVQNETGLLVTPGNIPELAEALTHLLCQPEAARRMGKAAQQRVDDSFSAKKQAKDHIALCE